MPVDNCNVNKYKYSAYGLTINSELLLPELSAGEGAADVEICLGKAMGERPDAPEGADYLYTVRNDLYFRIRGAGKYHVAGGKKIIVEPDEQADPESVKLFLLGTAMGAALLQRGILPIHGSAVAAQGRCLILTGLTGAGKSTLSGALRNKGCSFLTDDVAALVWDEHGALWVQPGIPRQKLCRDSVETMGGDVDLYSQINMDRDKYAIPVGRQFLAAPVRLSAIYEIVPDDCEGVSMKEVTGTAKLAIFMKHTYRVELLRRIGLKQEHFRQCADAANKIPAYRLIRPRGRFTLEEQTRYVMDVLGIREKM